MVQSWIRCVFKRHPVSYCLPHVREWPVSALDHWHVYFRAEVSAHKRYCYANKWLWEEHSGSSAQFFCKTPHIAAGLSSSPLILQVIGSWVPVVYPRVYGREAGTHPAWSNTFREISNYLYPQMKLWMTLVKIQKKFLILMRTMIACLLFVKDKNIISCFNRHRYVLLLNKLRYCKRYSGKKHKKTTKY